MELVTTTRLTELNLVAALSGARAESTEFWMTVLASGEKLRSEATRAMPSTPVQMRQTFSVQTFYSLWPQFAGLVRTFQRLVESAGLSEIGNLDQLESWSARMKLCNEAGQPSALLSVANSRADLEATGGQLVHNVGPYETVGAAKTPGRLS